MRSGFIGVSLNGSRWSARISVAGKKISLGGFETEKEAALAYDQASRAQFGDTARCNVRKGGRRGGGIREEGSEGGKKGVGRVEEIKRGGEVVRRRGFPCALDERLWPCLSSWFLPCPHCTHLDLSGSTHVVPVLPSSSLPSFPPHQFDLSGTVPTGLRGRGKGWGSRGGGQEAGRAKRRYRTGRGRGRGAGSGKYTSSLLFGGPLGGRFGISSLGGSSAGGEGGLRDRGGKVGEEEGGEGEEEGGEGQQGEEDEEETEDDESGYGGGNFKSQYGAGDRGVGKETQDGKGEGQGEDDDDDDDGDRSTESEGEEEMGLSWAVRAGMR